MPDKIPSEIAHERLIRLQALQEDLTKNWLSEKVGKECEILVEGKSARGEMFWQGRDEQGDIINIPLQALPASPLIKVKILEARAHTLIGKKVD